MIEGRHFVDLGKRDIHALRQRHKVAVGQLPEAVLHQVQILDEQIATLRQLGEHAGDLFPRLCIALPTLGVGLQAQLSFDGLQRNDL